MEQQTIPEIDTLLASLTASIDALKGSLVAQGLPHFRSDDLTPHPLDTTIPDPVSFYARRAIVGLCKQIISLVQDPAERSTTDIFVGLLPGCLRAAVATEPSIATVILEAGPKGITVDEVAERTGVDPIKLRSIARLLGTAGYIKELSVNCYVPTHSTLALCPGGGPMADLAVADFASSAAVLHETMHMPSDSKTPPPFEVQFKMPFYQWLAQNPNVLKRFHDGLTGIEEHLDRGIGEDVHLDDLGPSVTLVDLGTGHGSIPMRFLKRYPEWSAILQDTAEIIPQARQFWIDNMPEAVQSGRVSFLAHNFFEPSPLPPAPEGRPYVFMMKSVLHNWPDDAVKIILENLLPAAPVGTKLLIINYTPSIPETSDGLDVDEFFSRIKGKTMQEVQALDLSAPYPLTVGFGAGNEYVSQIDVMMMLLFNSRSRTTVDFKQVLAGTSWALDGRTQLRGASSVLRAHRV